METLGAYISVPFCRSKCSYCNFASGVFPAAYHERYIDRVVGDIRSCRPFVPEISARLPEMVDSVYLGGGTPSILAPDLLRRLLTTLRAEFDFTDSPEITVECAPGQIQDAFLAAMLDCGVNRVSFGVQSFIDREAAAAGRLHTRAIALRDIERVRRAGIRSVNADLIAGLPHQTAESWRESLDVLIASGVDHASIYMLEVDEDSRLGRELIDGGRRYHAAAAPSDDMVADFYLNAIDALNRSGLGQYEISNFARPGAASVHNKKYWLRQPYIGFGLDAHSMLRGPDGAAVRFDRGDDLRAFLEDGTALNLQPVSRRQALEEAWFLGLRLNEGVAMPVLEREFGEVDAHLYDDLIQELRTLGLLECGQQRVWLTERGRLMSNEVCGRFLREHTAENAELVLVD